MRFRRFRCLVISFVCLCSPLPSTAQLNGTGLTLSGYVIDDVSHQPMRSVPLQLFRTAGNYAAAPIISGVTGEYQFSGLSSGDYQISAHANGFAPTTVNVTLGGTNLSNITVYLHRIDSSNSEGPGSAISAHELMIPDKARESFEKGVKAMSGAKPDYRKALSLFERATKECPDYYEAYAQIGVADQHLGDAAAAERALRKSVEMSSSRYADALFLLAEMLNDAGRFIDSEVFARQCVTQDESLWSCDLELARAFAGLKRSAEAEAIASRAAELNPGNAKTFLILGNIHIQQHNYAAVVKDFDTYLKLNPSGPESDQVRASQAQALKALAKSQSSHASTH
jgi:tetratricopeptide (TPR) repeat protein